MNGDVLLKLWAKTVKGDECCYHPVLFHLLDVGNCAALLWDEYLTDHRKTQIAEKLGMTIDDGAVARLATRGGMHCNFALRHVAIYQTPRLIESLGSAGS